MKLLGYIRKQAHPSIQDDSPDDQAYPAGGLARLQKQYVEFCRSRLVDGRDSARDFGQMCAHEMVDKIAFGTADDGHRFMVVLTKGILLLGESIVGTCLRDIGQMAIVMRRKPNAELYFYNATRIRVYDHRSFHHPHVNENGVICSSHRESTLQELGIGRVWAAVQMSIDMLTTYGPDDPLLPAAHWPPVLPEKE